MEGIEVVESPKSSLIEAVLTGSNGLWLQVNENNIHGAEGIIHFTGSFQQYNIRITIPKIEIKKLKTHWD